MKDYQQKSNMRTKKYYEENREIVLAQQKEYQGKKYFLNVILRERER